MRDLISIVNLQTWYDIPDYNGYQIMFHSISVQLNEVKATVRSMKNFKKYPYGYILPYQHYSRNGKIDEYYVMTSFEGKRKKLTIPDICRLFIEGNQIILPAANGVRAGSRNRLIYRNDVGLCNLGGGNFYPYFKNQHGEWK